MLALIPLAVILISIIVVCVRAGIKRRGDRDERAAKKSCAVAYNFYTRNASRGKCETFRVGIGQSDVMKGSLFRAACLVTAMALQFSASAAAGGLVVHEWGTFTALQDETGRCLDGINTDDEPVPNFVHQLAQASLVQTTSEVPGFLFQGAPFAYPNVTLRLETPVIYFHPGANGDAAGDVDVKVRFRGGLLTEYYPKPERAEPAVDYAQRKSAINSSVEGLLEWNDLKLVEGAKGPVTDERVWLAPRAVKEADVKTKSGEAERYLFYRGLGTGEALLQVVQEKERLVIRPSVPAEIKGDLRVARLWLVDIQGGLVAFRAADGFTIPNGDGKFSTTIPSRFKETDYAPANALKLRRALLTSLKEEGLFEDEAAALLETWKISYFQSSGLRLFFIVPREWTDHVLPLEIPQAEKIVRAMVGRIELVSPRQRQILAEMNKCSAREMKNAATEMHSRVMNTFYPQSGKQTAEMVTNTFRANTGRMSLEAAGVKPVPVYKKYLELGRFRHTLVKNSTTNSPGLAAFAEAFRL
jgi:hypothetical protein